MNNTYCHLIRSDALPMLLLHSSWKVVGIVVSVLAFCTNDQSSNSAEVYSYYFSKPFEKHEKTKNLPWQFLKFDDQTRVPVIAFVCAI